MNNGSLEILFNDQTVKEILPEGHTFTISGNETLFTIEKVEIASDIASKFGLKINRRVPVYWIKGGSNSRQGGYNPVTDAVYIFENNTDDTTLHHELVHVIEYSTPPTAQLMSLWEKVKMAITEDSFSGSFVTFNFMRNIHEFIAEGKTRPEFMEALKKEGLYEDFIKETNYIFT